MSILPNDLTNLGLKGKEAKIYLSALELGYASVLEIAKKAEINRPTAYVVLESLMKKGLISTFEKGKKRYFAAESPEKFKDIIQNERIKLKQKEAEVQKLIPELNIMYNLGGEKPKVRFFEGKEGLRSIREDIIKSKVEGLDQIVPLDEVYRVIPPSPTDHRKEMASKLKNIPERIIYTSKKGKFLKTKEGTKDRRYVPLSKFPFSAEINIYCNKLAIATYKGKIIGVIIESKEIASTMKRIFDLSWIGTKKFNK
jgi:sugar-specific transcriptional regulator TrmB